MKLIVIHGPPGVGKLTVAYAIAALTTFKVFHNHLTIDCTKPVFEFGTDAFWRINVTLRREVIAEAARQNIDIVHTCCYGRGTDDEYFRELAAAAQDNGGAVHPVLLTCRDDVRRQRILEPSRFTRSKLTDPDAVGIKGRGVDLFSPHPDFEDVTFFLDNSDLSSKDAALKIIDRFGLPLLEKGPQ